MRADAAGHTMFEEMIAHCGLSVEEHEKMCAKYPYS
jgi:hypothetical protein